MGLTYTVCIAHIGYESLILITQQSVCVLSKQFWSRSINLHYLTDRYTDTDRCIIVEWQLIITILLLQT